MLLAVKSGVNHYSKESESKTSKTQDGSACIWDVSASFLYSGRKKRDTCQRFVCILPAKYADFVYEVPRCILHWQKILSKQQELYWINSTAPFKIPASHRDTVRVLQCEQRHSQ